MDDNPVGSLLKLMSFHHSLNLQTSVASNYVSCLLFEKRMLTPEVHIMSYITASFFSHQMEAITICLLSFKYFSPRKKNVYEQTTVFGMLVFSEMIL